MYDENWDYVFKTFPAFRDELLTRTGQGGNQVKALTEYLVLEGGDEGKVNSNTRGSVREWLNGVSEGASNKWILRER